jgi:antitoxin (DNA-binding transcriptional repressor) of toxin-antitoxin stability system
MRSEPCTSSSPSGVLYRNLYSGCVTLLPDFNPHTLSVTEAAAAGVPSLIRDAENGSDVIVARRGHPVAAVVSMRRLDQLRVLEADLRDLALVMTRAATDTGARVGLDEVISSFGFDVAELEAGLRAILLPAGSDTQSEQAGAAASCKCGWRRETSGCSSR